MRKFSRLAVALTVIVALSAVQACTSQAAFKATGTAVIAVDTAMTAYGEWAHAGKMTPEQRAQVDKAHAAYQASIDIAEKATFAYYASAQKDPKALEAVMSAVVQAAISVITIVNSFRPAGAPPIPVPVAEVIYHELVSQYGGR